MCHYPLALYMVTFRAIQLQVLETVEYLTTGLGWFGQCNSALFFIRRGLWKFLIYIEGRKVHYIPRKP